MYFGLAKNLYGGSDVQLIFSHLLQICMLSNLEGL